MTLSDYLKAVASAIGLLAGITGLFLWLLILEEAMR